MERNSLREVTFQYNPSKQSAGETKRGYFHKWATIHNNGESSQIVGIIEDEGGSLHQVNICDVKFVVNSIGTCTDTASCKGDTFSELSKSDRVIKEINNISSDKPQAFLVAYKDKKEYKTLFNALTSSFADITMTKLDDKNKVLQTRLINIIKDLTSNMVILYDETLDVSDELKQVCRV